MQAEGLFGSRSEGEGTTSRHDTVNVGVLLHHIETFPGIVVVITNLQERVDAAFFRRFKFVLEFPKPSLAERSRLWRLLIPAEAPLAPGVDFEFLARRYDFTGGNIKSAVFRAASRAALRSTPGERIITYEDLKRACDEEFDKTGSRGLSQAASNMFS